MGKVFFCVLLLSFSLARYCHADILVIHEGEYLLAGTIRIPPYAEKTVEVIRLGEKEKRIAVSLSEETPFGNPTGHPDLPWMEYNILIPRGYKVGKCSQEFRDVVITTLPLKITFVPAPILPEDYADPLKRSAWEQSLDEEKAVYSAEEAYPADNVSYEEKIHRGYRVLHLRVNPFQYRPATNELKCSLHIAVRIALVRETEQERVPDIYIRQKEADLAFIKNLVVNAECLTTYLRQSKVFIATNVKET